MDAFVFACVTEADYTAERRWAKQIVMRSNVHEMDNVFRVLSDLAGTNFAAASRPRVTAASGKPLPERSMPALLASNAPSQSLRRRAKRTTVTPALAWRVEGITSTQSS